MSDGCKLFVYGVDQYMENEELSVSFFLIETMAGKLKPQFSVLLTSRSRILLPLWAGAALKNPGAGSRVAQ